MKYAAIPSVMPEVFAESDSTMKTNDVKKPLSGFVTLAQIVNIFNRNPQGSALQMKRKQIKMLENNPSFTLYKPRRSCKRWTSRWPTSTRRTRTTGVFREGGATDRLRLAAPSVQKHEGLQALHCADECS
jgi:hypothetical protein